MHRMKAILASCKVRTHTRSNDLEMTLKNGLGRSFLGPALTKTIPGGMGRYAAAPGGTHIQGLAMVLSECQNMYQAICTNFRYVAGGSLAWKYHIKLGLCYWGRIWPYDKHICTE